ncbi:MULTISPECIES: hypothetical protein [Asticcacaulis]|uniref:hypothetical protein n=1 Tax=Asticcacaulis TaxID=76890 RepID=UPI001AE7CA4B|nr:MULTISPECIES: hypothetical protein [Asticcacaulis]MBP2157490.1 hypothetical protein [Asticcacaulis solisilvae]MDR6798535.1 hypothetical protein [Asticcacaulis sp. BE141]
MSKSTTSATELISNLKNFKKENFLELARGLRKVKENTPELFDEVIKGLRLHSRKAYYILNVEAELQAFGISDERLLEIGWTKLSLIAPKLTQENHQKLLKLAETHTAREVGLLLNGEFPAPDSKVLQIYLPVKDYDIVAKALTLFGAGLVDGSLIYKEDALVGMAKHVLAD